MGKFRHQHPSRRINPDTFNDYREYRPQLKEDFGGRCGYTDCSDRWWGVKFQVDHFAPLHPKVADEHKQSFLDGELNYNNLVYACPQVNNAKRNYWASNSPTEPINGDVGLLDPCTIDYNDYFERTDTGRIVALNNNSIAQHMIDRLKLYLFRYELYWRMEELLGRFNELHTLSEDDATMQQFGDEIKDAIFTLNKEFVNYFNYIGINQPDIA